MANEYDNRAYSSRRSPANNYSYDIHNPFVNPCVIIMLHSSYYYYGCATESEQFMFTRHNERYSGASQIVSHYLIFKSSFAPRSLINTEKLEIGPREEAIAVSVSDI